MRDKGRPDDDVRDYIAALATFKVTEREAEVARLVAWGFKNVEIAEALSIAIPTVKVHVKQLVQKLGVEDRAVLSGEVRLIVRKYWAEREQKRTVAAPLRVLRERKRRASRGAGKAEERQEA